ncbi:MAG TPA: hypothetical protein VGB75_08215 [Jatrophihabitans sp.]|uniref:hypothetical protein n=1 Tax=Jatrophihabitans sp. TaxID=1932789 RepID=UPI002EE1736A
MTTSLRVLGYVRERGCPWKGNPARCPWRSTEATRDDDHAWDAPRGYARHRGDRRRY